MTYSIHITNKGEQDITEAVDHIEFTLLNPTAADNLLDTIEAEIEKLSFMPEKHPIIDDPVLKGWKIRMIPVKNYLAFYVIDDNSHTVPYNPIPIRKKKLAEDPSLRPVSFE